MDSRLLCGLTKRQCKIPGASTLEMRMPHNQHVLRSLGIATLLTTTRLIC